MRIKQVSNIFRPLRTSCAAVAGLALACSVASAQDGTNVLLVTNSTSNSSDRIGTHYARARQIPPENIVRVKTDVGDEIDRERYLREIEEPISQWIDQQQGQDQILYIVLTKGLPLRIRGTSGRSGNVASVDSELSLLYRKLTGVAVPSAGRLPNPYYLDSAPVGDARRFTHEVYDIYLVSRLDGFSEEDAIALIDRSIASSRSGDFLLDATGIPANRLADRWLRTAADRLATSGHRDQVVFESTSEVLIDRRNVLGYSSLGSNDPSLARRRLGLQFVPGALASTFVSTDARTLDEPPEGWRPGRTSDPAIFYRGSPQSLSADLIREGATGVAGQVAEPFLDGAIRPDILFPAYAAGFNLVEAFYLAMPYLSWQTVIFGDPLCAPFQTERLTAEQLASPVDPRTELPEHFLQRRLAALTAPGVTPEVASLLLEGEARRRRGDEAGMQKALVEATTTSPGLNAAHLILATAYEKAGQYDSAIERYRLVLAATPTDLVAGNNLAYALAVYKNSPKEALPIAQKAYTTSKGEARVTDTLGWIHYLLGNTAEAEALIAQAASLAPTNAEIHLHLAHAHLARNRADLGLAAFKKSLQLDAALASREDVKKLRDELLKGDSPR
jgi:uncharacterized protein (TIGR03790 family)